jgi:hypothetical protein
VSSYNWQHPQTILRDVSRSRWPVANPDRPATAFILLLIFQRHAVRRDVGTRDKFDIKRIPVPQLLVSFCVSTAQSKDAARFEGVLTVPQ